MSNYLSLLNNAIEFVKNNEIQIAALKVADALKEHTT